MKAILLLCSIFLWSSLTFPQQDETVTIKRDYGLANVGYKIHGVYVFILAQPFFEYDYIATIKVKLKFAKLTSSYFERLIDKAKKKYTNFNGIVFQKEDLTKADLIRFKDVEITKSGFVLNEKVSFILDGKYCVGEVVRLGTGREDISVKFIDPSGAEKILELQPNELTSISDEVYFSNLYKKTEQPSNSETTSQEFKIGDNVVWMNAGVLMHGTITEINGNNVKVKGSLGVIKTLEISEISLDAEH